MFRVGFQLGRQFSGRVKDFIDYATHRKTEQVSAAVKRAPSRKMSGQVDTPVALRSYEESMSIEGRRKIDAAINIQRHVRGLEARRVADKLKCSKILQKCRESKTPVSDGFSKLLFYSPDDARKYLELLPKDTEKIVGALPWATKRPKLNPEKIASIAKHIRKKDFPDKLAEGVKLKKIGSGSFAKVYAFEVDGKKYAMKVFDKNIVDDRIIAMENNPALRQGFLAEVNTAAYIKENDHLAEESFAKFFYADIDSEIIIEELVDKSSKNEADIQERILKHKKDRNGHGIYYVDAMPNNFVDDKIVDYGSVFVRNPRWGNFYVNESYNPIELESGISVVLPNP